MIANPDHNEVLDPSEMPPDATYQLKGYADAGGGRRVSCVEISWDDGYSWNVAKIFPIPKISSVMLHIPILYMVRNLTKSGLCCFCWFWTFDVNIDILRGSDAVRVRYMDEWLALQPCDMHWNATGMMNNW